MKKDHPTEVFKLAAVVRAVCDDFVALGRPIPEPALAALELAESWLTGKDISPEALQAAAHLSHEEGVSFANREKDRALTWLRTAAGNLPWLAKKDRGWHEAYQSTMDAALYALSSLNIAGVKDTATLEAIYHAASAPPFKGAKKQPKPKPISTNLSPFIGAEAMKRLKKRKPVFEAQGRGSEEELRAMLKQHGYSAHEALIAFDSRYGGLIAADAPGEEGNDWIFGAYACLKSNAHQNPRGRDDTWVPVAYSPNDAIFFMDEQGIVWVLDTIGDTEHTRYADNGDTMMRRLFSEG